MRRLVRLLCLAIVGLGMANSSFALEFPPTKSRRSMAGLIKRPSITGIKCGGLSTTRSAP